ncbi:putative nuclease HARBI1 [Anguilla rostrata]|uniref:putative nuclease HARBI1 n=1 Tax=Anguilla rostrata TaxID=7938 RepID=UPI0030CF4E9F
MYNSARVLSAGRAVLELLQSDWEPLSHRELEWRLDQAVEDILETELIEKARTLVGPTCPQQLPVSTPPEYSEMPQQSKLGADNLNENDSIQYIKDLLQNSDCGYNRSRRPGRPRLSLNHTVLLSLALLSSRLSYRSVSARFRVEKGNIHRIFFSFCDRVNALENQHIRWLTGQEAEQNLQPFSGLLGEKDLPRVFGILGSTRIPLRGPVGKQEIEGEEERVLEKETHLDSWLNLELVCDSQGKFMHCRISKGSDSDKASSLKERLKQQPEMLPRDSYLIARLGYPLSGQILTPYPTAGCLREKFYNQSLEAHLDVFDQATAELKSRFQRLKYLDMVNFDRAKAVVLTACILHNMFLEGGDRFPAKAKREMQKEAEGEIEEDGVRKREAIADLLYIQMKKSEYAEQL